MVYHCYICATPATSRKRTSLSVIAISHHARVYRPPQHCESEQVPPWWRFHPARGSIDHHNILRVSKSYIIEQVYTFASERVSAWWRFNTTHESVEPHNFVRERKSHRGGDSTPRAGLSSPTILFRVSKSQLMVISHHGRDW